MGEPEVARAFVVVFFCAVAFLVVASITYIAEWIWRKYLSSKDGEGED